MTLSEMATSWDYRLVILSVLIAILGSYIALDFAGRMRSASGRLRTLWFAGGAIIMGLAIWSMHFIGMLALQMPMPMSFGETLSVLSILAAITGSGIAFILINQRSIGAFNLITGSIAMGLAIVTMHYIGMASMQMEAVIRYDPLLFSASIAIAMVASAGALWLAFRMRSDIPHLWLVQKVGSAGLMGAAIAGMHYTGMAAATYYHVGAMTSGVTTPCRW